MICVYACDGVLGKGEFDGPDDEEDYEGCEKDVSRFPAPFFEGRKDRHGR